MTCALQILLQGSELFPHNTESLTVRAYSQERAEFGGHAVRNVSATCRAVLMDCFSMYTLHVRFPKCSIWHYSALPPDQGG